MSKKILAACVLPYRPPPGVKIAGGRMLEGRSVGILEFFCMLCVVSASEIHGVV